MSSHSLTRTEIFQLALRLTLVSAATYFSIKYLISHLDPTKQGKSQAKKKAQQQIERLGLKNNSTINVDKLSDHELMIAANLISPEDIEVTWANIGGLESVTKELYDTVILPIKHRNLFTDSKLTQAPKGVLLHGPPGVGKTMIAKATAREAGTRFINLDVSILTEKWYGESQKLTAAVFTLAMKIQPCIIFIDEIDSFLRVRNSTDHEVTAMMKAQFMSFWDGLITDSSCTVIIMGATNRPWDIDSAILRRMPAQFHIPLPNKEQRKDILKVILEGEPIDKDVDLEKLADLTENCSGSDLKELCRNGSVYRVREFVQSTKLKEQSTNPLGGGCSEKERLRAISMEDLVSSSEQMRKSTSSLLNRLESS